MLLRGRHAIASPINDPICLSQLAGREVDPLECLRRLDAHHSLMDDAEVIERIRQPMKV
jgi:hypothetical protein